MKVLVISCFAEKNDYSRGNFIFQYFQNKGHDCLMIHSEFQHSLKKNIVVDDENWIPIKTISYSKNVSIKRILSHLLFGIKAARLVKINKPEVVYLAVPPNSITKFIARLSRNLQSKVIIDIVDLWPESFPVSLKAKHTFSPLLNFWQNFRDNYLKYADTVMFECDLYREYLEQNDREYFPYQVIPLAKKSLKNYKPHFKSFSENTIHFCYLGNINLLIDIEHILKLLSKLKQRSKVKLHLIATGNKKQYFIEELNKYDIDFIDYGSIYNEPEKYRIMSHCDFGINLYKENTQIGLTYKSIDYLAAGLPLLNSIKSDTWNLVDDYKIGVNCNVRDCDSTVLKLIDIKREKLKQMKHDTYQVYRENFEYSVVVNKLDELLNPILL